LEEDVAEDELVASDAFGIAREGGEGIPAAPAAGL